MENKSDSGIITSVAENSTLKTEYDDIESRAESHTSSNCTTPDANRKYLCPICEMTSTSQHEFTIHIRSHNFDSQDVLEPQKTCVCSICCKILSSTASLDRHMLIHSGERPFSCKYCGDTFTTNGNMHRHMRTHSNRTENYESDGSTDSGASTTESVKNCSEFNNNKIKIRKRKTDNREYVYKRLKNENCNQSYICPVCERDDFNTIYSLEMHIQDNHFDYPAKCTACHKTFSNYKVLKEHKLVVHTDSKAIVNSVVGFTDLTFVDFSSQKFPHIARYECEKNLHKVVSSSGLKFQCGKCKRAFPCATSLDIHEINCSFNRGLDLSCPPTAEIKNNGSLKQTDFFAKLDLQTNNNNNNQCAQVRKAGTAAAASASADIPLVEAAADVAAAGPSPSSPSSSSSLAFTKSIQSDLADIQSIISITSDGTLLQQLHEKDSDMVANARKNCVEDEAQDIFAAEFRKMKLRGEFPCRLCSAVFPNLRALKGHNRTHLNSNSNGGAYRCNMCPHSSLDKAALIRHMRSHNGDRPYECSLCNYAFTTKANCERHLRNRHSKNTREEVKKSIIYHPSEDPGNEDMSKILIKPEDVKHHTETTTKIKEENAKTEYTAIPPPSSDLIKFSPHSDNTSTPFKQTISIKKLNEMEVISGENNLDIVLDLSKKKSVDESTTSSSLSSSTLPSPQSLLKNEKTSSAISIDDKQQGHHTACRLKFDPTSLYTSQFAFYGNALPNVSTFPFALNPLLFETFPASLLEIDQQISRDKLKRYPLHGHSSTNTVAFTKNVKTNQQRFSEEKSDQYSKANKSTRHTISGCSLHGLMNNSTKSEPSSVGSVKMVIKNGVLMPKQKQRRYRTERPFSCEYCSARFTLRSNMERHIKQQHPQFWSQRQRSATTFNSNHNNNNNSTISSNGGSGRRSNSSTMKTNNNYCNLSIPAYDVLNKTIEQKTNSLLTRNHQDENEEEYRPLGVGILESLKSAAGNQKLIKDGENRLQSEQLPSRLEEIHDLVPVSRLLVDASQQPFKKYFQREIREEGAAEAGVLSEENQEEDDEEDDEEEEEEGLIANSSTSDENNSATDENRSESEIGSGRRRTSGRNNGFLEGVNVLPKKKSAYSLAPNRVSCPYCQRKFPWTSSLRRHVLTHTGQKPFKCNYCPLLFTTKSNCDRHLLRKHGSVTPTTLINNTGELKNNNNNYLMRNVPERPFKCSSCPSSTFSTFSNLKKHIDCKHAIHSDDGYSQISAGYEAGSSEDEKANTTRISTRDSGVELTHPSSNCLPQSCDLPFKCHLCEGSFIDRQSTIDHIKANHIHEYELLMSKNAFDINNIPMPDADAVVIHQEENDEGLSASDLKGSKFPDYANRKVVCAFCMRRFWSAEDLRRHMRTHTGERPFSCDICLRRFTLKHSMLRHRKKHNIAAFENIDNANSDEEVTPNTLLQQQTQVKREEDATETSDLISNLLGIRDRSIIDQVLTVSADTAAKLLGVKNN